MAHQAGFGHTSFDILTSTTLKLNALALVQPKHVQHGSCGNSNPRAEGESPCSRHRKETGTNSSCHTGQADAEPLLQLLAGLSFVQQATHSCFGVRPCSTRVLASGNAVSLQHPHMLPLHANVTERHKHLQRAGYKDEDWAEQQGPALPKATTHPNSTKTAPVTATKIKSVMSP